jgi:hypothetical protein
MKLALLFCLTLLLTIACPAGEWRAQPSTVREAAVACKPAVAVSHLPPHNPKKWRKRWDKGEAIAFWVELLVVGLLIAGGVLLLPSLWWVSSFLFALALFVGVYPFITILDKLDVSIHAETFAFFAGGVIFLGAGVAMALHFTWWLLPLILIAAALSGVCWLMLWVMANPPMS